MHDDDAMDRLLRGAMAAEAPRLSHAFETAVMRRVRPRRLSARGRVTMVVYAAVALALSVWSMRGLDLRTMAVGVTAGLAIAAGASAYVRRLASGD